MNNNQLGFFRNAKIKRNYWVVRLGKGNIYAKDAKDKGYIGVGFLGDVDLSNKLYEDWRRFNREMIPIYLEKHPEKKKIAAGLACGNLWTVIQGIQLGDRVVSPVGDGTYIVGEIIGKYEFSKGEDLPHRRPVKWHSTIKREDMTESLRNSIGSIMTAFNVSKYATELDTLTQGMEAPGIIAADESVEDPTVFGLEEHLEDFLVINWKHTELGKKYDLFEEDGEIIGQQYPTEIGPIDILAQSKDKKEILVIELKKGRTSDAVIGQVLRYMGYIQDELAEKGQLVRGLIIAHEDDRKLRLALKFTRNVDFTSYSVHFKLNKANK